MRTERTPYYKFCVVSTEQSSHNFLLETLRKAEMEMATFISSEQPVPPEYEEIDSPTRTPEPAAAIELNPSYVTDLGKVIFFKAYPDMSL